MTILPRGGVGRPAYAPPQEDLYIVTCLGKVEYYTTLPKHVTKKKRIKMKSK